MSGITFTYKAMDREGANTEGSVDAATEQEAYRKLSAKGLTPVSIRAAAKRGPVFSAGQVTQKDITALTRELSVLLESNIPLAQGLRSIAEHEKKPMLQSVVLDVAVALESGDSLSVSLEKHRALFGDVYIETMRAAEKSGEIDVITAHLADMLERQMETRQMLKRAMTYPVIVLAVVAVAVSVIVVYVIPRFGSTFAAQGIEMPIITRMLIAVGESARQWWWLYAAGIAGAIFSLVASWRSPGGRLALERLLARAPYISKIIAATTAAQFSRVFGIGLGSGLDVIESIEMGGRATGRRSFALECDRMADSLRGGSTLEEVLKRTESLPSFARRMLGAGKDSKELSRACTTVSRHYDREGEHLTKNINTIIEPLMTVVMAVIVLVIALSVFLPMWKMMGTSG